jgi:hypothetical protein
VKIRDELERVGARGALARVRLTIVVVGLVFAAPSALAQEVRIQVARGPYYVGEGIEVQVIATDFDEEPQPEISAGPFTGGQLRLAGVSPSTSTSISFINGKLSRVHDVSFVYRYQFVGTQPGPATIPDFTVAQGGVSRRTEGFALEIVGVPSTDRVAVDLELPEGPIFVGQKIPIAIEFRIDRQTQRDLVSYRVHVPLFEDPTLRFLDEVPPEPDTHLEIQSAAGTLRLPALSSEIRYRGREALVVRAERTMIALSTGELRIDAPQVFISQGAGFRRDVFNQRRATSTEKFMASGDPIRLEVAEVPREGRPGSFAGAVGSGFSLEVDADRSVVQLGEPIMLSFHLRGDGDLSSASLPNLDAEGLLDPAQFRLPEDSPAGIVDEDGKHFDVTLRVLDAGVREIPALAYSWFDAGTRRFETTHSRPIALSVGAAEIIGADAVMRGEESTVSTRVEDSLPRDSSEPIGDGVARSTKFSLTGANLAVDRDLSVLLVDQRARKVNLVITLPLYAAGIGFLGLAAVFARRRAADPHVVARTIAYQQARLSIDQACAASGGGGAAALGRALRELLAALPEEGGSELDALIAECDALRFAPVSGTGGATGANGPAVPPELAERARRLLEARLRSIDSAKESA